MSFSDTASSAVTGALVKFCEQSGRDLVAGGDAGAGENAAPLAAKEPQGPPLLVTAASRFQPSPRGLPHSKGKISLIAIQLHSRSILILYFLWTSYTNLLSPLPLPIRLPGVT
ncbi:hypothetical protein MUG91_G10n184 [Manis pentadactyla]|nr:hypothetical protein MUG91_G10n184 [Manis pentadactyla]